MTWPHHGKLLNYDQSYNLPIREMVVEGQFSVEGVDNYQVSVYPDVKSSHQSQSPDPLLDEPHPTIYWNIGNAIAEGRHYPSTSKNKDHLARSEFGHVEVYQLDNFFEKVDNIAWSGRLGESMIVPVFYPYDGGQAKALTCYFAPNPTGKELG